MRAKQTRRVTLEDVAAMVERNIAHKEDIERLRNHLVRIEGKVDQLPTRTELLELLKLRECIDEMRRNIRDKLHVEV